MYIVTFYSFKGGVGRSMSLVNVGVQLAQAGRKVLLVDFDLEAPGLPTFNLVRPAGDTLGIVDYITRYIATCESPDVRNYIYESDRFDGGGRIWIMPVGLQDVVYSRRLNSINWQRLYDEQAGYLFFEDLKSQWKQALAPDYVLIDSRTGHSDVEGICTRQLPDAVCLLFFPNEQNLNGLKRIVSTIRADQTRQHGKAIRLHFAVSNVPDLDDEDHILLRTMRRFSQELGYEKLSSEIHHYNSLSLLDQEIFSLNRPNSRLTKEYRTLTSDIRSGNLEDRDAVLEFLDKSHRDISKLMRSVGPQELQNRVEKIQQNFGQDGEVCFYLARLQEQIGSSQDALSLLSSDAVQTGYANGVMFAARARLNDRLGNTDVVVPDIKSALDAENIDLKSLLEITPLIDRLSPKIYDCLPESKAFLSLSAKDKLFFVLQSEGKQNQLRANVRILKDLTKNPVLDDDIIYRDVIRQQLVLASIGSRDFSTAIDILYPAGKSYEELPIADLFNLSMAHWGRDRKPNIDLVKMVACKHLDNPVGDKAGPNYMQCLSITYAVLGDSENAELCLEAARRSARGQLSRIFSAWTYSKVSPKQFLEHLTEIGRMIAGEQIEFPLLVAA